MGENPSRSGEDFSRLKGPKLLISLFGGRLVEFNRTSYQDRPSTHRFQAVVLELFYLEFTMKELS
jgi:hypothetical protein